MQTKSPLVRIGMMAGASLAILALFVSAHMQRHAPSSGPIASNHSVASAQPATQLSVAQKENVANGYGKLPLAFEANQGQTAPEVRYLAHGQSYQLFLTNQEAVLTLRQPAISGTKQLPGKTNYFIGNDPKKWHTDVPSYEAVCYRGVYPGVDVLFYGRQ